MAAPITTDQSSDLIQYKDLIIYLTAILDKEATIPVPVLSAGNITEMNDAIALALVNIQGILTDVAPAP